MSRIMNNRLKMKKDVEPSANIPGVSTFECDIKIVDSIIQSNTGQSSSNKLDVSTQQDSLNLDYHSGLCTQTQDGGVEVTWDWHSPGRKTVETNEKNVKTHEIFSGGTPKRATIIHQKRISNSPLMYKPLKRKLIKKENTDDIDKFKAELIALSEKIKNAQKNEKFPTDRLEDIVKINIPRETEFSDCSENEIDLVVNTCDKAHELSIKNGDNRDEHFHDLFDDSLNDTMIKCSQEIEERLNIAPDNLKKINDSIAITNYENKNFLACNNPNFPLSHINETKLNSNLNTLKSNVNVQIAKCNATTVQGFTLKNHKSNPITFNTVQQGTKNLIASTKIVEIPLYSLRKIEQHQLSSVSIKEGTHFNFQNRNKLKIPDDSFDEFLATCEEDFSQSDINFISTNSSHYGKVYDNVHSMSPKKTISFLPEVSKKLSPSTLLLKTVSNVSECNTVNKDMVTKSGVGNSIIQLNKTTLDSDSTPSVHRNWKFFKSKSHSDSSFASNDMSSSSKSANQINFRSIFKAGSNLDVRNGSRGDSGLSVSTEQQIQPVRPTTSYLDSNAMMRKSMRKVNSHNSQIYHVNRCAANEDGKIISNNERIKNSGVDVSVVQLQVCGPEEIRRKRMEAKMKLNAKKKRERIRNNSKAGLSCVPFTTPNKSLEQGIPLFRHDESTEKDISNYIKQCPSCQMNKTNFSPIKAPMEITSTSSKPFEKFANDIVGPLCFTTNDIVNEEPRLLRVPPIRRRVNGAVPRPVITNIHNVNDMYGDDEFIIEALDDRENTDESIVELDDEDDDTVELEALRDADDGDEAMVVIDGGDGDVETLEVPTASAVFQNIDNDDDDDTVQLHLDDDDDDEGEDIIIIQDVHDEGNIAEGVMPPRGGQLNEEPIADD